MWRRVHVDPRPGLWRALREVQTPVRCYLPSVGHEAAGLPPATVAFRPGHHARRGPACLWPPHHCDLGLGVEQTERSSQAFWESQRHCAPSAAGPWQPGGGVASGPIASNRAGTGLEAWALTHFLLTLTNQPILHPRRQASTVLARDPVLPPCHPHASQLSSVSTGSCSLQLLMV